MTLIAFVAMTIIVFVVLNKIKSKIAQLPIIENSAAPESKNIKKDVTAGDKKEKEQVKD